MQFQDIKRKKSVQRYAPNSYRIFQEEVGNDSLPQNQYQAPQLYTQPLIVPSQGIEDRNRPHAGQNADFLRQNVSSLNEPINNVRSRNGHADEAQQWWKWNTPKDEMDSALKNKKRINNVIGYPANPNEISSYATTYQKDMGYLNNVLEPGTKIASSNDNRFNHNGVQAQGIVPINDLTTHSNVNGPQRVFVDKMSFEQNYDSRNEVNYAQRGRRQGAFVLDQVEPKPGMGLRSRPQSNGGSSVWNAMHPSDCKEEDLDSRKPSGVRKVHPNPQVNGNPNDRRDPIGYFNDKTQGGSYGYNNNNSHNNGNEQRDIFPPRDNNNYQQDNTYIQNNNISQENAYPQYQNGNPEADGYQPSWNQAPEQYYEQQYAPTDNNIPN